MPLDGVRWVVGAVNPGEAAPPADALPAGVTMAPAGRTLREMLVAGELDVLVVAWAPAGFYEPDSPIVRLFPDFRRVEREYYRRTGLFPAHHIVVLRRDVVDAHPEAVRRLYTALCRAREHAVKQRASCSTSRAPGSSPSWRRRRPLLGPRLRVLRRAGEPGDDRGILRGAIGPGPGAPADRARRGVRRVRAAGPLTRKEERNVLDAADRRPGARARLSRARRWPSPERSSSRATAATTASR